MSKQKEQRAAQRAEDAEAIAAYESSRKVDLDAVLGNIMYGPKASSPNGGSGLIDKRADQQTLAGKKVTAEHINWDGMLGRLGRIPTPRGAPGAMSYGSPNSINLATLANRTMEKFKPVVSELNKFKFAASPDLQEAQMRQIVSAVREVTQKMAINDVAMTTRRAYDNVADVGRITSAGITLGMKVTYKVGPMKVAVTAKGDFTGDEIVCLEQEGTQATAYVVRPNGADFEDLSGAFDIKFEQVG
jgi:hypothetical protein